MWKLHDLSSRTTVHWIASISQHPLMQEAIAPVAYIYALIEQEVKGLATLIESSPVGDKIIQRQQTTSSPKAPRSRIATLLRRPADPT